jgi:hypothetical protein
MSAHRGLLGLQFQVLLDTISRYATAIPTEGFIRVFACKANNHKNKFCLLRLKPITLEAIIPGY